MNASNAITITRPQTFEIPYPIKRAGQYLTEIGKGALAGGAIYGGARAFIRLGLMDWTPEAINFVPYVLGGVIYKGIIETATLIYEIGQALLGERARYENLAPSEQKTTIDSLRHRSWKVIGKWDKLQSDIDGLYSRVFGIRTAKEMRENKIFERDLYQENLPDLIPSSMETFRHVFWQSTDEWLQTSLPKFIVVKVLTGAGYTLFPLFMMLTTPLFLAGTFLASFAQRYQRIKILLPLEDMAAKRIQQCFAFRVMKWNCFQPEHLVLHPKEMTDEERNLISFLNQPETTWDNIRLKFEEIGGREIEPHNRAAQGCNSFIHLTREGMKENIDQILNGSSEDHWLLPIYASILDKMEKARWADVQSGYELMLFNPLLGGTSAKLTVWEGYFLALLNQPSTKWKDLENVFKSSANAQPHNRVALTGYAFILCKGGKVEEAEKLVNEALKSDLENFWLLSIHASILNRQGKLVEAAEALERASKNEHPHPFIEDALMLMFKQLEKPVEQPVEQPAKK